MVLPVIGCYRYSKDYFADIVASLGWVFLPDRRPGEESFADTLRMGFVIELGLK